MSERLTYVEKLNGLMKHNFLVVNTYKKKSESEERSFLRRFYQHQVIKRSDFITELNEEIQFLGGSPSAYSPGNLQRSAGDKKFAEEAIAGLKTCIKVDKECLKKYRKAISSVNEASSREILIRQKAIIENAITEMKVLKVLTASAEKTKNVMINKPDKQAL